MACEVASGSDHTNDTLSVKSTCSNEAVAGSLVLSAQGVTELEELFVNNVKEEVLSSAELRESNLLDGSNYDSFEAPSYVTHEAAAISDPCSDTLHSDFQELKGDVNYISLLSICGETFQDHPYVGSGSPKGDKLLIPQQLELPVHEEKQDSTSCTGLNNVSSEKKSGSTGSLDSSVEGMIFDGLMGDVIDKSLPSSIASRSGQIISIDLLEEFILDANKNKVPSKTVDFLYLRMW